MMAKRRFLYCLLCVVGLSSGLTVALAQDEEAAPDESAEAVGDGEVEAGARTEAPVSREAQLSAADTFVQRAQSTSTRVQLLLDEARRAGDIIRVTCLDDKLTQINAKLRQMAERRDGLAEAWQGDNSDRAEHEYTVLTVQDQAVRVLDGEASACLGQDIFNTGDTSLTTLIDRDTPTSEEPQTVPEAPTPVSIAWNIPPPMSAIR